MIAALPILLAMVVFTMSVAALFAPCFLLAWLVSWLIANRCRRLKQAFWCAIYPAVVWAFICGAIFDALGTLLSEAAWLIGATLGLLVAIVRGIVDGHAGWKRGSRVLKIFGLLVALHLGYDYSQPARALMLNSGYAPAGPVNRITYVRPVLVVTWSRR